MNEGWKLADRELTSRLIVGTGGVQSLDVLGKVLAATGTELTTVAMRRVNSAGDGSLLGAIRQACGSLFATAGLQPDDESPAPPALVRAGLPAARCLRAHGLPNYRDPNSDTPFTPGHGFSLSADELPNNGALGKQDPAVQRAFHACRPLLDAEIRASSLSSLSHD